MLRNHLIFIILLTGPVVFFSAARAASVLPYTTRTQPYTAYSATTFGDLSTLGMAGSNIAIPTTGDTTFLNPAGLPMTFKGTQVSLNGLAMSNAQLDPGGLPQWNLATSLSSNNYPWGFGISLRPIHQELQQYSISGQKFTLENSSREITASIGRVFFQDRLSIGLSLILGQSYRATGTSSFHLPYALGTGLGVIYQMPKRFFLAAKVNSPMTFGKNLSQVTVGVADFFQESYTPWRGGVGAGWIPNRHFRFSGTIEFVGAHAEAGLLSDQLIKIGHVPSIIPRVGISYYFAEYSGFKAKFAFGTYLETSRIQNQNARLHVTTSLQLNPWIFYLGAGADAAEGYQNIIYSTGIDFMKLLEVLELAPPMSPRYHGGFFPPVSAMNDTGLSRAILTPGSDEWKRVRENPEKAVNLLHVGRDLPGRLKDKIRDAPEDLKDLAPSIIKNVEQVVKDTGAAVRSLRKPKKKSVRKTNRPTGSRHR